jgi:hypothetical protein
MPALTILTDFIRSIHKNDEKMARWDSGRDGVLTLGEAACPGLANFLLDLVPTAYRVIVGVYARTG